jgi:hypothetical protein
MDWIKKHADTIAVITSICASLVWMNGKFNEIEKDLAIVKTVLIMKNIMPAELAKQDEERK